RKAFRGMKGRYSLREASGGWCRGQGSSGTWTWPVILNRRFKMERAAR
ncbi:hypothetical protein A2U01_0098189, partial [Trifolium medium]|nr:hypothetical protein [Trifolium medium]